MSLPGDQHLLKGEGPAKGIFPFIAWNSNMSIDPQ